MRTNSIGTILKAAAKTLGVVFFGAIMAFGQDVVNLTSGPVDNTLPDGSTVHMWGYSCGAVVGGSLAKCAKLNPAATGWSPIVITIPTNHNLQISLTNNLSFGANHIPTSLTIVGQLGGGLGTTATTSQSPNHPTQFATWAIAGDNSGPTNTPPAQGPRVQSFATEVAATGTPVTLPLWNSLRPGTYLIESGTHPSIQGPMGLYGMLIVTDAPTATSDTETAQGTAYPGVKYDAEVPLLLSEIDPVQNNEVTTAVNTVGFSESMVWSGQPGACGDYTQGNANAHKCYPPAVNYTPLYYFINGVAFNKSSASASLFPSIPASTATPPATGTGSVLVRFVNAGLRMHVPSIVGSQSGAASGFSLIAEDGNPLPGTPRVQSEVFLPAGKTYDVMLNATAPGTKALPVFDRQLSLSGNSTQRDTGMLAYIGINGGTLPDTTSIAPAVANPDSYSSVISGQTLTISDSSKGVIANDVNVYGVKVTTVPTKGQLVLYANGTFTYTPNVGWTSPDTFVYQANGNGPSATVTLTAAAIESASGITVANDSYSSNVASSLTIRTPGVLGNDTDAAGYPLIVAPGTVQPQQAGLTLAVDQNGGFTASLATPCTTAGGCPYSFTYKAKNSQGTVSASSATATITFPQASGLAVTVLDAKNKTTVITDYRWVIEEDRTFYINPNKTANTGAGVVPTFGVNFHTSNMTLVAQGCTGSVSCEYGQTVLNSAGAHVNAVCDLGDCNTTATQLKQVLPSAVHLDPAKRYYISVLPGDGADPFNGTADNGHGMGGAPIAYNQTAVTVLVSPTPLEPAKISVQVFQDDSPLNGEQDGEGNSAAAAPIESGLGGFNLYLFDDAGGTGDSTGQMTYDMFNMPLSNSLAGTVDPLTNNDACPIAKQATDRVPNQAGIVGTIVTCPRYESDGKTISPLAGQAVIANMMPGRYAIQAVPGADRIAKGEEWLQTNTLDGTHVHDVFLRVGEPSSFQEYGPAGFHVSIGFANPKIINDRLAGVCAGTTCTNSVDGQITGLRMSRTPDERVYGSGTRDAFGFTQCYVSLGETDGDDFAFTKCDGDGKFNFTGIPNGNWRITVFDQWNDQIVDGLSTPLNLSGGTGLHMGEIPVQQWHANISTQTFIDQNGNGIREDNEPGLALVSTNIRFRDGSFSNFNSTDLQGNAGFNEVFPLFSWYVIESDSTRYKNTGTHVVYDAGGPADGTAKCGTTSDNPCGTSADYQYLANTYEKNPVPVDLQVPGAVYCSSADCSGMDIKTGHTSTQTHSTGRIDPPWVANEAWQGFSGQTSFIDFGKKPFAENENGGIRGHVVYASTRPFDDPKLLLQLSWEPLVPNVTVNLYKKETSADGSQTTLKLVDTTKTSSWDDWAQGFRTDGKPNMNCPGQSTSDLFYFTLQNQPNYLDAYNHGGTPTHTLPYNSQYKCYDGLHNWNQIQPASYDGLYQFPSVTSIDPITGKPTGTNCTTCISNPDITDPLRLNTPMLPSGKYVVEVVVPPGYELVKEEDKNILIGDNYIAPVTQQFAGLGSIFIMPDQASVASSYNPKNPLNSTQNLGNTEGLEHHEGDTGSVEAFWPCAGAARVVPDFISLFPQSAEVAPFAGATRNLCDRKEVTLDNQSSVLAKFYLFTSTHIAAHFTGVITDDSTSEFDPFSPSFGEKFAPPNMPVSLKDTYGNEINRVYADQWGAFNGMNYSTWEVNPPNPTGYAPTMMVTCMNDPGPIPDPAHPGQTITDPLYNPGYSQFCYELPFMPGQTDYMDTPVVPSTAFAGGYNLPDASYPDYTPAIKEVDGDGVGPWILARGASHPITISALGDQIVNNYGYAGPSAKGTVPNDNKKTITRHYGFGNTQGTVTIGGITASITSWTDTSIVVTLPSDANVQQCAIQQQDIYAGNNPPTERCGELIITAANGKKSIDAITVTIGGKAPTRVPAGGSIQAAIDAASPGDLIIVPPGRYTEMLLMWKPVRLQGVGAASTILNANTHPSGKIDVWRRQVNCLFGLAINGGPISGTNPYDSSSTFNCDPSMQFQVDRLPLEGIVGWDATLNGNLAEILQEPTLMGAYEGAGITVLAKGVKFPNGTNPFGNEAFPAGTSLLSSSDCTRNRSNPYPSNFLCNPSRIDGLSVTNSSQGGGGIFVHGWAHNLEIANNRIYNNVGSMSGGITVGQGEVPPGYFQGSDTNDLPGSCGVSTVSRGGNNNTVSTNTQLPYCFNINVNVHHNAITLNSSIGDIAAAVPVGAGGATFLSGSDKYNFTDNWVSGNMGAGDGGGFVHAGLSYNPLIQNNSILFNQSINPTIPTNGGGILVTGVSSANLSDGTGPGMVINANLIQGNSAESGSGGGIRFEGVNGTDVVNFPTSSSNWYSPLVTNNIIVNNIAGWDGGGISLQDALAVNIINNTIASNDSTATAGPLNPEISVPNPNTSGLQAAGLVTMGNTADFTAALAGQQITCPSGHYTGSQSGRVDTTNAPTCGKVSYPLLANNLFWQNRSFDVTVGGFNAQYNQKVLTLNPTLNQPTTSATNKVGNGVTVTGGTGACVSSPSPTYWDIGVRGDSGPGNHGSGTTLSPLNSVLTSGYSGSNNTNTDPNLALHYCNGSRVPPESLTTPGGYNVPVGISDAVLPNPIFSLTPTATVDEGNNWINLLWGPLSSVNPVTGLPIGDYALTSTSSSAINNGVSQIRINNNNVASAPSTDFFGRNRLISTTNPPDIGAVEFFAAGPKVVSITPDTGARGTSATANVVHVSIVGTNLTGTTAINAGSNINVSNIVVVDDLTVTANFNINAATIGPRDITLTTGNGTSNPVTFTVVAPAISSITPTTGIQGTTVPVTITGVLLTGATGVFVSGTNVVVTNFAAVNDTTVTANFVIASNASTGARDVAVVMPNGNTNTLSFTVIVPPPPTFTQIAPNSGLMGTTVPVTLTGSNFVSGTTVTVRPTSNGGSCSTNSTGTTNITVGPITVLNATTITTTFTISGGDATRVPGQRCVWVYNGNQASAALKFTITAPPAPTLVSMTPSTGNRGATISVALVGTSLTGATATAVSVSGSGVTYSNLVIVDDSHATASFIISGTATLGAHNVTISVFNVTSNSIPFTVTQPPPPTLVSITPNSGLIGTTVPVSIVGTNLTGATSTSLSVSGSGVSDSNLVVVDDSHATATLTISTSAAAGSRNVTISVLNVTSNSIPFTVTLPPPPTLTSITPNTGNRGTTVSVSLVGTNLTGATSTALSIDGSGVSDSNFVVVDDSHATANVTISATAGIGVHNITITVNGQTSSTSIPFTVGNPPTATLSAINPTSGTRGATINVVTLTGTNFTAGTTVSAGTNSGITISNISVVSSTQLTARFVISSSTTTGTRNVTVTNANGTASNAVTFTIN